VRTSLYYLSNARDPSSEKRSEHIRRIERNVARADEVITTLTNFARVPEPEVKPFSLEPCVREALGDGALPDGVEVAFDFPTDLPPPGETAARSGSSWETSFATPRMPCPRAAG
jgi:hypothetical protein